LSLNEKAKENSRVKTRKIWNRVFGFRKGERVRIKNFILGFEGEEGIVELVNLDKLEYGGTLRVILVRGGWLYCFEEELERFEET